MRRTLLAAAISAAVVAPATAQAAYPGENGRTAYKSEFGLFSIEPDGSRVRNLAYDRNSSCCEPSYSGDGRQIAFMRDYSIWKMRANGKGKREVIDGFVGRFVGDGALGPEAELAFTADRFTERGDLEPIIGPRYCPGIYLADPKGSNQRNVTERRSTERCPSDTNPAFSPDGTRIAFNRGEGFNPGAIWTVGRDGSGLRRVTEGLHPDYSPDGRRLVYTTRADGVFTVRTDGGGRRRVKAFRTAPTTPERFSPDPEAAFSPDGRRIAYIRDGDLYTIKTNGRGERRLTRTPNRTEAAPSWGVRRGSREG